MLTPTVVNRAFDAVKAARVRVRELERADTSRFESPMIRAHQLALQEARDVLADAELDLDRIRLLVQQELAENLLMLVRRGPGP